MEGEASAVMGKGQPKQPYYITAKDGSTLRLTAVMLVTEARQNRCKQFSEVGSLRWL